MGKDKEKGALRRWLGLSGAEDDTGRPGPWMPGPPNAAPDQNAPWGTSPPPETGPGGWVAPPGHAGAGSVPPESPTSTHGTAVREPGGAVVPPVAAISGTVRIEQVVVGDPSPSVPSRPTAPQFRSVPFRPDTVIDGWTTSAASVRAASLRGHLHRYNGAPRQDDVAVHVAPSGRIIAVVADGVSAALHSHIGASTATTVVTQWVLQNAEGVGDRVDWTALVRGAAWGLAERARGVMDDPDVPPEDIERNFATTLVAAVIDPVPGEGLAVEAIGVGDSSAWVLTAGEFRPLLGGKAADAGGISSSAVAGLPRVPTQLLPSRATIGPADVLLLGSDGIGDPLGAGQGGVGELLRGVLTPAAPSLIEFANAVDFSREAFDDDRTLVAVWSTEDDKETA